MLLTITYSLVLSPKPNMRSKEKRIHLIYQNNLQNETVQWSQNEHKFCLKRTSLSITEFPSHAPSYLDEQPGDMLTDMLHSMLLSFQDLQAALDNLHEKLDYISPSKALRQQFSEMI
jgi:hypothetical protein